MLLLISGALFLTLGIPGLTAGVSFGLGIGLSALGGVLVVSGLLCLLVKREVSKVCPEEIPAVQPEETPEGVPVTPFEKPALDEAQKEQKTQKILDQLPQELDQLDRYIQEVFACLGPLKDLKYEDQGFLQDVKEEFQVFDFVQKDMIAEFVELQQILCQEGRLLEFVINQTRYIGRDLFKREDSLYKLWEWLGYLPSGDVRGERLKKSAREVVDRFMRTTCNIRKIAMTFDRHVYSVAKTAFEKAFGALETCVYESMRESYREAFCEYEKAKLLGDEEKSAHAEQRFQDIKNRWEDVKDAFFWVKEDGKIEIDDAIGNSCKWSERYEEHRITRARWYKVAEHQLFNATMRVKDSLREHNEARVAFEKERSKENQRQVQKKKEKRLRDLKELHDQELPRAQERLRELQALYPEIAVSVVEARREVASDLEKAHESIDKHYQSCVREQELY
ncbi:HB2 protein [Chlamydia pneumoniae TW-183]|uniref:HB2 protein n=2 Tax=Chlamydia pneumoniae TaxID=83558 RepID=Q9JS25_CHLPN|nr:hypothetical protein CP_0733 [Chlamydia pneumoniae AR39]AAP97978.1 HB2 protein [Chlamydia pneumoniae TW-183]CRI35397.1 HB2 protein [Chlamydia pneumoniae]BAA98253.1 hypothetical protein [Chlamydia pneumoniae J138]CRI41044.1 HB2 protein [Chlamydia pneumoniae]